MDLSRLSLMYTTAWPPGKGHPSKRSRGMSNPGGLQSPPGVSLQARCFLTHGKALFNFNPPVSCKLAHHQPPGASVFHPHKTSHNLQPNSRIHFPGINNINQMTAEQKYTALNKNIQITFMYVAHYLFKIIHTFKIVSPSIFTYALINQHVKP